jgi:hypothetical protein
MSEHGARLRVGRRRFLTGALWAGAAGVLHACSTTRASAPGTGASATGTPATGSTTGSATGGTAPSPPPSAAVASDATSEPAPGPSEILDAATTSEPAERVDPPAPSGTYDREALYVALYGFPGSRTLGVLGEQGADDGVRRAQEVARQYADFGRRVVPTFEILASVASSEAGADGDFSNEFDPSRFQDHVDAAAAAGMHVVFDLQSGRARFPDQAREYEALWMLPHASIALDPEWRVGPLERPGGGFIGSVDAAEVNETIDYVDEVIRRHGLPPKMCIVHQFDPAMITNKQQIRGTDLVQVVIQMDGFGTLAMKRASWARTVADLPAGAFTGWKNFYDEDQPTPTPAETMANEPAPRFVSYQ